MHLSFQMLGLHIFLARQHLIGIAADGIDLTVVYHETVRMCSLPTWIGVGRETRMYHSDSRFKILALQISKESTELTYQEHSFINNGSAGKRNHISIVCRLLKHTSCNVKSAVKSETLFHISRLLHKALHNVRHAFHCFMSQYIRKSGNFTPAKEFQAFLLHNDLKHFLCLISAKLFLREEEHANTIFSLFADLNSKSLGHSCEKFMRNLGQDTNTVTGLAFCILTSSML